MLQSMHCLSALPSELWLLIVDHVLADTSYHGRWRDLVHLSWTCRAAYAAAHRPLWHHLRLMFRVFGERNLEVDPTLELLFQDHQRHDIQLLAQVHQLSVFPRYRKGQLAENSHRMQRIRKVSQEYVHVQPFVVLDGRLYLASLLENERNRQAPDMSGLESLWGSVADVRLVDGLLLVPYPLHLVTELTISTLGSAQELKVSHLLQSLAFVFQLRPIQLRALHFYSTSCSKNTIKCLSEITRHYQDLAHHDYSVGRGEYHSPAIGQATRSVCASYWGKLDRESDNWSRAIPDMSRLPLIDTFELHGYGALCLTGRATNPFTWTTLTRLVLNYNIDAGECFGDVIPVCMPNLKQLTVSCDMAYELFGPNHDPSAHFQPGNNAHVIFPSLTHLTLADPFVVDSDDYYQECSIHWIPYHHMPALTHWDAPLGLRVTSRCRYLSSIDLHSLVAHTRLESFIAPSLKAIRGKLAVRRKKKIRRNNMGASRPVADRLAFLEVPSNVALEFGECVHAPNLTSVHLHVRDENEIEDDDDDWPSYDPLVHGNVGHFTLEWWTLLARGFGKVQHLAIMDQRTRSFTLSESSATPDASGDAGDPTLTTPTCFLHLESLALTATHLPDSYHHLAHLDLPALTHLTLTLDHPPCSAPGLAAIYARLESLRITIASQCPAHVAQLLDHVPTQCRVKLLCAAPAAAADAAHPSHERAACQVHQLRARFAGAANRHVWRALLAGPRFGAAGSVKGTVVVEMADSVPEHGDPELVAKVLAHLVGGQEEGERVRIEVDPFGLCV